MHDVTRKQVKESVEVVATRGAVNDEVDLRTWWVGGKLMSLGLELMSSVIRFPLQADSRIIEVMSLKILWL